MDFTLTPGQRLVQEKARLSAEEVKEKAALLDREGLFPEDILKLWAAAGFVGLSLPKEFGGGGHDYMSYCLAQMELAQASPSAALILHLNHSLFGLALAQFATPEQKRHWTGFARHHRVAQCRDCDAVYLECEADRRGKGARA